MKTKKAHASNPSKARTGIEGFDETTGGGLLHGRTTLRVALTRLRQNTLRAELPGAWRTGFGWNLASLRRNELFFLDAQPKGSEQGRHL